MVTWHEIYIQLLKSIQKSIPNILIDEVDKTLKRAVGKTFTRAAGSPEGALSRTAVNLGYTVL